MHWDGTAWAIVPSPNSHSTFNALNDIAVFSPTDIWAVGSVWDPAPYQNHSLVLHWNGSVWEIVEIPMLGTDSYLNAVTAIDSNNVWVIGRDNSFHWDGSTWISQVTVQGETIAHLGSNNVWVANGYVTLNWNGRAWKSMLLPYEYLQSQNSNELGIIAPDNIYIVGVGFGYKWKWSWATSLHWNGNYWRFLDMPYAGDESLLNGLAIVSPTELWAVGSYLTDRNDTRALLYRAQPPCTVPPPTPTPSPTIAKPPVPQLLAPLDGATKKRRRVTLDWERVAGATGYEVHLILSGGNWIAWKSIKQTKWETNPLRNNSYLWRVRACRVEGDRSECSHWSNWSNFNVRGKKTKQ